jgi:hypothetical protein
MVRVAVNTSSFQDSLFHVIERINENFMERRDITLMVEIMNNKRQGKKQPCLL